MASASPFDEAGTDDPTMALDFFEDGMNLELEAAGRADRFPTDPDPALKAAMDAYAAAIRDHDAAKLIEQRDIMWNMVWNRPGEAPQPPPDCDPAEVEGLFKMLDIIDEAKLKQGQGDAKRKRRGPQEGGGISDFLDSMRTGVLRCFGRCRRRAATQLELVGDFLVRLVDEESAASRETARADAAAAEAAADPAVLRAALEQEGLSLAKEITTATLVVILSGGADFAYLPIMTRLGPAAVNSLLGVPSFMYYLFMRMGALGTICAAGGGLATAMIVQMVALNRGVSIAANVGQAAIGAAAAAPGQLNTAADIAIECVIARIISIHAAGAAGFPAAFSAAANALQGAILALPGGAVVAAGAMRPVLEGLVDAAGAALEAAGAMDEAAVAAGAAVAAAAGAAAGAAPGAALAIVRSIVALMGMLSAGGVRNLNQLLRNACSQIASRVQGVYNNMNIYGGQAAAVAPGLGGLVQPVPGAVVDIAAAANVAGGAPAAASAAAGGAPGGGAGSAVEGRDAVAAAAASPLVVQPPGGGTGAAAAPASGEAPSTVSGNVRRRAASQPPQAAVNGLLALSDRVPNPHKSSTLGGHRCRSCGNVFGKTRRAARGKTAKKGGKKAVRKGSFRKGRKHSKKQRR